MTKKKTTGITNIQKAFIVGAVVLAGIGLYAKHAKAADLLYTPKPQHIGYVDEQGWYFALRGGADFANDYSGVYFDTGYNVSGSVGYQFGEIGLITLREEAEVGYFNSDASPTGPFTGSASGVYGLLNTYADFNSIFGFTPFINAGIGYADVNGKVQAFGFPIVDAKDQSFAWDVGGGISYPVSKNVTFDVAYRYLAIPDITLTTPFGAVSDDLNQHQINAGFRVKL